MISKIKWLTVTLLLSSFALAQETVIYQFGAGGPNDGAGPNGGLVFDAVGNMYGTTIGGGSFRAGTMFELSPLQDGTWQETILYSFCPNGINNGCPDGREPEDGLVFDASGNLYGTTTYGGLNNALGEGTVFELSPPSQPGGSWTEQVVWSFGGVNDGLTPNGGLSIDAAGNLYGTTLASAVGVGSVFELSPGGENGWTEAVLYDFCLNYPDCSDGAQPEAGVTIDKPATSTGQRCLVGRHTASGGAWRTSCPQRKAAGPRLCSRYLALRRVAKQPLESLSTQQETCMAACPKAKTRAAVTFA